VLTTSLDDGVLAAAMDDGKMNAIGHGLIEELHGVLDRADADPDVRAVCLSGNGRALSAGFDLTVMTGSADGARALVRAGGELLLRLYVHPRPCVVTVTGHALAAGALLTLACDTRIATAGPAKIGLNEVAIGLALPQFAWELAAARLAPAFLTRATVQAEIFDPAGAIEAGFVDRVEADPLAAAMAEARRLAGLPGGAYGSTKRALRQPLVERVLAGLDRDLAGLAIEPSPGQAGARTPACGPSAPR
jgi:enoyl-CoA hydratase